MELNITEVFNTIKPTDYSASAAEIGANAGPATWRAAVNDSPGHMLLNDEDERAAFKEYIRGFGAWDDEEIATWSDVELNALFLQMIAGEMREADLHAEMTAEEWQAYQKKSEAGQVGGRIFSGRIFGGPLSTDGEVYYSLD